MNTIGSLKQGKMMTVFEKEWGKLQKEFGSHTTYLNSIFKPYDSIKDVDPWHARSVYCIQLALHNVMSIVQSSLTFSYELFKDPKAASQDWGVTLGIHTLRAMMNVTMAAVALVGWLLKALSNLVFLCFEPKDPGAGAGAGPAGGDLDDGAENTRSLGA